MREIIRFLFKVGMQTALRTYWIFPVKRNRIVLLNECNFQYADSPRCIAEYLRTVYPGQAEIIFPVKAPFSCFSNLSDLEFVRFGSVRYYYYALTARIFLTNDGGISYLPIRKDQFVINTWHGGGAYKTIAGSLNQNPIYKKELELSAKKTDLFLSSSKRFTEVMAPALGLPKYKFCEIGLPRNDMLSNPDKQKIRIIRKSIGLNCHQKLVLYAPTFRRQKNVSFGKNVDFKCHLDVALVAETLSKKFGGKWIMGCRYHPSIKIQKNKLEGEYLDLSDYPNMQELLLAADVLITDYSSSIWDFMITRKPAFIYAEDLVEYSMKTKFYTPISEWPFLKASNNHELIANIACFDISEHLKKCELHYVALGGCETGCATKTMGDLIVSKLKQPKSLNPVIKSSELIG